jgi:hypothetical protein
MSRLRAEDVTLAYDGRVVVTDGPVAADVPDGQR